MLYLSCIWVSREGPAPSVSLSRTQSYKEVEDVSEKWIQKWLKSIKAVGKITAAKTNRSLGGQEVVI